MASFTSLTSVSSKTIKKSKRYNFHNEWEEDFFFTQFRGKCVCLICNSNVALAKKSNVERHYRTVHKNFEDKFQPGSDLRKEKVGRLKSELLNQQSVLNIFNAKENRLNPIENASGMEENVEDEAQLKVSDTEPAGSEGFSTPNKRLKQEQRLSTIKNTVNDHISSSMPYGNQSEENEFDIFGLYVSTCLKKLPLPRAFRLQEKINSLIVEERISYASHTSPCSNGMTARNQRPDNDDLDHSSISASQSSHDELVAKSISNFNDNSQLDGRIDIKTEAFEIECDPSPS